jgi:hypothetical protein
VSTISKNAARTVGEDLETHVTYLDCSIRDPWTEKVFSRTRLASSSAPTAGLTFREKYSFLTLHPARLLV